MRATVLLLLVACRGSTPPTAAPAPAPQTAAEPPPSEPACVDAYVRELGLPHVMWVERRHALPADGSVATIYAVAYGEGQDCESGCFHSNALLLVRGCDRMGWMDASDYDGVRDRFEPYRLDPDDEPLYDPALWDELRARDEGFFRKEFLVWLSTAPDLPDEVAARVAAELTPAPAPAAPPSAP